MKTVYRKYGLTATVNENFAEVIDNDTVVWYGNVPSEATPKDILEMYIAIQKSPANSH